VNYVTTDQQRNPKARFLDSNPLQFISGVDINHIQNSTDPPISQTISEILRRIAFARIQLAHLPDLFGQRHRFQ
jgi:hypothetical protein